MILWVACTRYWLVLPRGRALAGWLCFEERRLPEGGWGVEAVLLIFLLCSTYCKEA